jgi:hypothetical protein
MVATTVIERLKQEVASIPGTEMAFFFCHSLCQDPRTQTLSTLIGTLISQVLARCHKITSILSEAFFTTRRFGRFKLSLADEPVSLLLSLVCSSGACLYLIIGGLGEFAEAAELARALASLLRETNRIRIFDFSRTVSVLGNCLSTYTQFQLTADLTRQDIQLFINMDMHKMEFEDSEIKGIVLEELYTLSGGMILWTKLMVQTIQSATSSREMLDMLRHHPADLNELYSSFLRIMSRRSGSSWHLAKRALLWTCNAARPPPNLARTPVCTDF